MPIGTISIDGARCKGCGLCVTACPPGVIGMANDMLNARGYHPARLLDVESKCTGCAACAIICPDICITVYRQPRPGVGGVKHEP